MRRLATFVTGLALVAFVVLVGAVPVAASNVLEVPVAFPTIQAAIDAAVSGDTVLVDPGTYFENIDFKGKLITVQSAQGPSVTTIDGGNAAPVVNFSNGETTAAVLQGFTLQHGNGTFAFGYEGAGVHINGASPTVVGNVITNNVSCADGTGISIAFASPVIRDNTISGNSKQAGCSGQGGGGIYVRGAASAQIVHNTITGNSSDFGGGIDLFAAGTPTLLNNTISNNTAGIQGGGIYAVNQSDASIAQNVITGNTSAQSGGAVYVLPPSGTRGPFFVNNTFANNTGSDSSLWLGGFDGQVQLSNNIVSVSSTLPAILCDTTYSSTPPNLDHNDVFNAAGPAVQGSCGSAIGSSGNISTDPSFVSSTDFHLQATSPAVDAGNNAAPSLPASDLDGKPRICGPAVDLGVYELQRPLALAAGSAIFTVEGLAFSATLGQFVGGYAPFSATILWGDGQSSAAVIVGGAVDGTHAYAEEGAYTVTVSITDSTATTASGSLGATASDAPLTITGRQVAMTEGSSFAGTLASFTDADPGGVQGDYVATISWGDQSTSAGVIAPDGNGAFVVTGTHTYAEEGGYTVLVTVTDAGGASASTSTSAGAGDAPLSGTGVTVAAVEGATFSGPVSTFTDGDPNGTLSDYTATINWGDHTTSPGIIAPASGGGYTVSGNHAYAEEGTFTVTVTTSDVGSAAVTTTAGATVSDAALAVTPATAIAATEGASVTTTVAVFTDADPGGAPADYTATIDWGDQTTSAGTIASNPNGGFAVTGAHVYAEEGRYSVKVTVIDVGGATAAVTAPASVADAAVSATGKQLSEHHGTTFTATIATLTDADPGGTATDYTGLVNWGDGTTTTCSGVSCAIVRQSNGTFSISASHNFRKNGKFTVTIRLSDVGGATATTTTTISVG